MNVSPTILLIGYCILILLASLAGGWLPMLIRLTHRRMQFLISFVSGVMLGIALLDLLPHAWHEHALADPTAGGAHGGNSVMLWMLGGFLAMFLLERFFCFHHHEVDADGHASCGHHDHGHDHDGHSPGQSGHALAWGGAMIGLTIHSLIAGVALAASVLAGHDHAHDHGHAHDHTPATLAGLGTFFVIFLHKPFDSLTLGAIMATGGHPMRKRHLVNGLFALTIPLGAIAFALGIDMEGSVRHATLSAALAFSAGTFLCISLADLLPELQFHSHDRIGLTLSLLAGLALALGMTMLETMG